MSKFLEVLSRLESETVSIRDTIGTVSGEQGRWNRVAAKLASIYAKADVLGLKACRRALDYELGEIPIVPKDEDVL